MAIYNINGTPIAGGDSGIDYDFIIKTIHHRGYSAVYPENTIPAFKGSKTAGANYVETDVRFTSDGVAVLLHDESINRTARNSDGTQLSSTVNIADITYEQSQTYDFGIWKGSAYAGTKIPTLTEFLTLCKNIGLKPYIELKVGTQAQIEGIVDAVTAAGLKGRATYISFTSSLLGYVKTYDDHARLGFLGMGGSTNTAASLKTEYNEVFMDDSNKTMAASCISKGIGYEVWTIDSASTVEGLDPYITGVTTNGGINAGKIRHDMVMD